jgi:hypothetical protein
MAVQNKYVVQFSGMGINTTALCCPDGVVLPGQNLTHQEDQTGCTEKGTNQIPCELDNKDGGNDASYYG